MQVLWYCTYYTYQILCVFYNPSPPPLPQSGYDVKRRVEQNAFFEILVFLIMNPLLTSSCNSLASFTLPRKLIWYGRSDFQAGYTLLLFMA